MTSVLRQAFTHVKNLFFPAREREDFNVVKEPTLHQRTGIKRLHDHFEAELTEDDDDIVPPINTKRLKLDGDSDISIVYYRHDSEPTFASLAKTSGDLNRRGMEERRHLSDATNSKTAAFGLAEQTSNSSKTNVLYSFGKSDHSTAQTACNENTSKSQLPSLRGRVPKFFQGSSCFSGQKTEDKSLEKMPDDNKSGKPKPSMWFNQFGKTMEASREQADEKQRYMQLLDKITKAGITATHQGSLFREKSILELSRVEPTKLETVYNKWDNTSPYAQSKRFPSSPNIGAPQALLKDIRLFSTNTRTLSQTMKPPSPFKFPPIVVDLEKENLRSIHSGKSPTPKSPRYVSTPAFRPSFMRSYSDLKEAERRCAEEQHETFVNVDDKEEEKSLSRVDDDLIILSESIVQKGRQRRVNSLALEQESSPFARKSWLDNLSSEWRDNQEHRKKQLEMETNALDILRTESTIDTTLREAIRKKLTLTEIIELEEQPLALPDITDEMNAVILYATQMGRDSDVLGTVFSIDITRGDIKTLAPCKWLNDNVINVYMELIAARSREGQYPKCHVFSTFFYPKYLKEGYSNALKRWTRKVDVFAHDLIIFPIHLGMHWCLAVADLRKKCVKYYDSLGGRNDKCLRALLDYLKQEMKERKSQVMETLDWNLENVEGIPEQQNGSDCGMFTCKFAECLSREAKLDFIKQENMNYYRRRMVYELIKKDILFP